MVSDYDKKSKRTIGNKVYDVQAYHPKAFESGAFTVRFHEKGKPRVDRYSKDTIVRAKNRTEAIKKARHSLF